jgi:hypothetical protein
MLPRAFGGRMKGFPNQVADLGKLAQGMRALIERVDAGENPRDDGVLGPALVRAGVAGTGHGRVRLPVERYIREQFKKKPSARSFGATARGLRELYELFGFINVGQQVRVTDLGRQAAAYSGLALNAEQIAFWRRVIRNMTHDGGDGETSHPYQVLLHLVGQKPGITRAKCALALEAKNDSPGELARIERLANLREKEIIRRISGGKPANWENAKKVLPSLAERLSDVVVTKQGRDKTYRLADAPGRADAGPAAAPAAVARRQVAAGPLRAPRTSRVVTPDTIGRGRTLDTFDENAGAPSQLDPAAAAAAVQLRLDRFHRHELIVHSLAVRLDAVGAEIHVDPFDILALVAAVGILVEVKTLDGTEADEREQVRDAFGQLQYYEPFAAAPVAGQATIHKIACFERPISEAHRAWLNASGIGVIWRVGDVFAGDVLATRVLGRYIQELR